MRKIDYHINLIKLTGKNININNNLIVISGNIKDIDIDYTFKYPSVGGTINGLLMYSKFKSQIILRNYAKDPYIYDIISFLKLLGKNIYYDDNKIIIHIYYILEEI